MLHYNQYQSLVEQKIATLLSATKAYLPSSNIVAIKLAIDVAEHAHHEQRRKSGEPYITHPLEVATIISNWRLDAVTIVGAILHDVIEDSYISKADITQIFGVKVAELVDGVTKLEKINFASEELAHAEYFRKMVLAMAKDVRVILIKLADRLHNMLTLDSHQERKRKLIAHETMEIYVPIADKIGLHNVKTELANESFKRLHPLRYDILQKAITTVQHKRLKTIKEIMHNINDVMRSNGISGEFKYQQRTVYNVYRRMVEQKQSFNRIYDIFEIKIVVNTIGDCYLTLGVLHGLYQPILGKFADYIAIPKSNGYQSIHSTLMGPSGTPIQIHIRTTEMDKVATTGIMTEWLHLTSGSSCRIASTTGSANADHRRTALAIDKHQATTHSNNTIAQVPALQSFTKNFINNILDIQSSSFSAYEFLQNIKHDLSPVDVYVFTPKGKIITLPQGATPIDFAYSIHSEIGNHICHAKINQRQVNLGTKLKNGDIVEIVTKKEAEPQEDWLQMVTSGRAVGQIKHYLKEQKYEENIDNGKRILHLAMSLIQSHSKRAGGLDDGNNNGGNDEELIKLNWHKLNNIVPRNHHASTDIDSIYSSIGNGEVSVLEIAKIILDYQSHDIIHICLDNHHKLVVLQDESCLALPASASAVCEQMPPLAVSLNKCGALVVHRKTCKKVLKKTNLSVNYLDNFTYAHIINNNNIIFLSRIFIVMKNIPGTFNKLTSIVSNQNINIEEILQQPGETLSTANVTITLRVINQQQVDSLHAALVNTDFITTVNQVTT